MSPPKGVTTHLKQISSEYPPITNVLAVIRYGNVSYTITFKGATEHVESSPKHFVKLQSIEVLS